VYCTRVRFGETVMLGCEDLSLLVNTLSKFFWILAAFPEFCVWRHRDTRSSFLTYLRKKVRRSVGLCLNFKYACVCMQTYKYIHTNISSFTP